MPITWEPDCGYSIQEVQQEVDRQRIALGMQPQRDEEAEREASSEWRTVGNRDYNKSIYVSLDPGKKQDYSAIIFLEPFLPKIHSLDSVALGHQQFIYHISRMERLPLGTPYPTVARVLRKAYQQLKENPEFEFIHIVIDVGGVGEAVADQIIELISGADVYRVALTGGRHAKWNDARSVNLPKPEMASSLISLFESHRIWVAPEQEQQLEALRGELVTYERKIGQNYDSFGAMKIGAHDDTISAIGCAAWLAEDMNGGSIPTMW